MHDSVLGIVLDRERENYDIHYEKETGKVHLDVYATASTDVREAFARLLEARRSGEQCLVPLGADQVYDNPQLPDPPELEVEECEPGEGKLLGTVRLREVRGQGKKV